MRVLYVSLVLVLVDQISKLFVKGFSIPFMNLYVQGLEYAEKHNIIGSFLRITFVENPGMAFGIDPGVSSKLFLSLFSVVASVAIVIYLYKVRDEELNLRLALALILAGAVGNLIDRVFYGVFFDYAPLFYGKVVDFIDIDFFDINLFGYAYDRWPIFNVADMAVSIGVVMLIFAGGKKKTEDESIAAADCAEAVGSVGSGSTEFNGDVKTDIPSVEKSNITKPLKENGEPDNGKELQV